MPKITIMVSDTGIQIAAEPGIGANHLFTAAALLTRNANKLIDAAEAQQMMAGQEAQQIMEQIKRSRQS